MGAAMPQQIASEPAQIRPVLRRLAAVHHHGVLREVFLFALLAAPALAFLFGSNRLVASGIWIFYLVTGLALRGSRLILGTLAGAWFGYAFGPAVSSSFEEMPERMIACVVAGLGLGFVLDQSRSDSKRPAPASSPNGSQSRPTEPILK